jgi:hypothetical protein
LEAPSELAEGDPDTIAGRLFGDEFVVTAAQVLNERMAGRDRACRAHPLESAHRTQPRFEPTMISLDGVVGIPLNHVPRPGRELVDHPRVDGCPVGLISTGTGPSVIARVKNAFAASALRRVDSSTSMTWLC